MIENKKTIQRSQHKQIILDALGKDATAKDALDYLLGDIYGRGNTDYRVYRYTLDDKTMFHRFNAIWVWPIFMIIAPFTWLFTGKTGVNSNSKIGRVVNWLVKFQ